MLLYGVVECMDVCIVAIGQCTYGIAERSLTEELQRQVAPVFIGDDVANGGTSVATVGAHASLFSMRVHAAISIPESSSTPDKAV